MATTSIDWTFEELGRNMGKAIDCTIWFDVEEPEPRTWDYPGSPGGVAVCDVHVTGWDNDTDVGIKPGSWQTLLDNIAFDLAEANLPEIRDHLREV